MGTDRPGRLPDVLAERLTRLPIGDIEDALDATAVLTVEGEIAEEFLLRSGYDQAGRQHALEDYLRVVHQRLDEAGATTHAQREAGHVFYLVPGDRYADRLHAEIRVVDGSRWGKRVQRISSGAQSHLSAWVSNRRVNRRIRHWRRRIAPGDHA